MDNNVNSDPLLDLKIQHEELKKAYETKTRLCQLLKEYIAIKDFRIKQEILALNLDTKKAKETQANEELRSKISELTLLNANISKEKREFLLREEHYKLLIKDLEAGKAHLSFALKQLDLAHLADKKKIAQLGRESLLKKKKSKKKVKTEITSEDTKDDISIVDYDENLGISDENYVKDEDISPCSQVIFDENLDVISPLPNDENICFINDSVCFDVDALSDTDDLTEVIMNDSPPVKPSSLVKPILTTNCDTSDISKSNFINNETSTKEKEMDLNVEQNKEKTPQKINTESTINRNINPNLFHNPLTKVVIFSNKSTPEKNNFLKPSKFNLKNTLFSQNEENVFSKTIPSTLFKRTSTQSQDFDDLSQKFNLLKLTNSKNIKMMSSSVSKFSSSSNQFLNRSEPQNQASTSFNSYRENGNNIPCKSSNNITFTYSVDNLNSVKPKLTFTMEAPYCALKKFKDCSSKVLSLDELLNNLTQISKSVDSESKKDNSNNLFLMENNQKSLFINSNPSLENSNVKLFTFKQIHKSTNHVFGESIISAPNNFLNQEKNKYDENKKKSNPVKDALFITPQNIFKDTIITLESASSQKSEAQINFKEKNQHEANISNLNDTDKLIDSQIEPKNVKTNKKQSDNTENVDIFKVSPNTQKEETLITETNLSNIENLQNEIPKNVTNEKLFDKNSATLEISSLPCIFENPTNTSEKNNSLSILNIDKEKSINSETKTPITQETAQVKDLSIISETSGPEIIKNTVKMDTEQCIFGSTIDTSFDSDSSCSPSKLETHESFKIPKPFFNPQKTSKGVKVLLPKSNQKIEPVEKTQNKLKSEAIKDNLDNQDTSTIRITRSRSKSLQNNISNDKVEHNSPKRKSRKQNLNEIENVTKIEIEDVHEDLLDQLNENEEIDVPKNNLKFKNLKKVHENNSAKDTSTQPTEILQNEKNNPLKRKLKKTKLNKRKIKDVQNETNLSDKSNTSEDIFDALNLIKSPKKNNPKSSQSKVAIKIEKLDQCIDLVADFESIIPENKNLTIKSIGLFEEFEDIPIIEIKDSKILDQPEPISDNFESINTIESKLIKTYKKKSKLKQNDLSSFSHKPSTNHTEKIEIEAIEQTKLKSKQSIDLIIEERPVLEEFVTPFDQSSEEEKNESIVKTVNESDYSTPYLFEEISDISVDLKTDNDLKSDQSQKSETPKKNILEETEHKDLKLIDQCTSSEDNFDLISKKVNENNSKPKKLRKKNKFKNLQVPNLFDEIDNIPLHDLKTDLKSDPSQKSETPKKNTLEEAKQKVLKLLDHSTCSDNNFDLILNNKVKKNSSKPKKLVKKKPNILKPDQNLQTHSFDKMDSIPLDDLKSDPSQKSKTPKKNILEEIEHKDLKLTDQSISSDDNFDLVLNDKVKENSSKPKKLVKKKPNILKPDQNLQTHSFEKMDRIPLDDLKTDLKSDPSQKSETPKKNMLEEIEHKGLKLTDPSTSSDDNFDLISKEVKEIISKPKKLLKKKLKTLKPDKNLQTQSLFDKIDNIPLDDLITNQSLQKSENPYNKLKSKLKETKTVSVLEQKNLKLLDQSTSSEDDFDLISKDKVKENTLKPEKINKKQNYSKHNKKFINLFGEIEDVPVQDEKHLNTSDQSVLKPQETWKKPKKKKLKSKYLQPINFVKRAEKVEIQEIKNVENSLDRSASSDSNSDSFLKDKEEPIFLKPAPINKFKSDKLNKISTKSIGQCSDIYDFESILKDIRKNYQCVELLSPIKSDTEIDSIPFSPNIDVPSDNLVLSDKQAPLDISLIENPQSDTEIDFSPNIDVHSDNSILSDNQAPLDIPLIENPQCDTEIDFSPNIDVHSDNSILSDKQAPLDIPLIENPQCDTEIDSIPSSPNIDVPSDNLILSDKQAPLDIPLIENQQSSITPMEYTSLNQIITSVPKIEQPKLTRAPYVPTIPSVFSILNRNNINQEINEEKIDDFENDSLCINEESEDEKEDESDTSIVSHSPIKTEESVPKLPSFYEISENIVDESMPKLPSFYEISENIVDESMPKLPGFYEKTEETYNQNSIKPENATFSNNSEVKKEIKAEYSTDKPNLKRKLQGDDDNTMNKIPRYSLENSIDCTKNSLLTSLKYLWNKSLTEVSKPCTTKNPKKKTLTWIKKKIDDYASVENPYLSSDAIARELKDKSHIHIAKFILEILLNDNELPELCEKNDVFLMTSLQKKFIILIVNISHYNQLFENVMLTKIEETVCNFTSDNMKVEIKMSLAQIHTLICKKKGYMSRSRAFLFDVLYTKALKAYPIVHKILVLWSNILPNYTENEECLLNYTIAQLIIKIPTCWKVSEHVLKKYALSSLKKVVFFSRNYNKMDYNYDELFYLIIDKIMIKGNDLALLLLSRCQGFKWTISLLERKIIPILNDWENVEENLLARLVVITGKICRGFPHLDTVHFINKIINIYQKILQKSSSIFICDATVEGLALLKKHNLTIVANVLACWKPKSNILTQKCVENIKSVINMKNIKYWNYFIDSFSSKE